MTQKVEVQEFWRKMFSQRKIYDIDDLEEASKLLAEIYPIREGMGGYG